jgi:ABC-type amino acid transport system permease subunit
MLYFWALRPMLQAVNEAPEIRVSFKTMLLAGMATTLGAVMLIAGENGLPKKRNPSDPLTPLHKLLIAVIIGIPLLFVFLCWMFFRQHGYGMTF